jgi:hypothetical protein
MAGINSNIHVMPGNELVTVSPHKNIMFTAKVDETFPTEFAIWDLNQFLSTYSLLTDSEVVFGENHCVITSGRQSCKYHYADTRLVNGCRPPNKLNLPPVRVVFDLPQQELTDLLRAAAVLQLPDIMFTNEEGVVKIVAFDKEKANTTNRYEIEAEPKDMQQNCVFKIFIKSENLKLLPGDYEISLCEKLAIQMKHQDLDATYVLAVTSDSVYNGVM